MKASPQRCEFPLILGVLHSKSACEPLKSAPSSAATGCLAHARLLQPPLAIPDVPSRGVDIAEAAVAAGMVQQQGRVGGAVAHGLEQPS